MPPAGARVNVKPVRSTGVRRDFYSRYVETTIYKS